MYNVCAVNENTRIQVDFNVFLFCLPSLLIHTSAHVFISLLALGQVLPYFNLAFPQFSFTFCLLFWLFSRLDGNFAIHFGIRTFRRLGIAVVAPEATAKQ